MSFRIRVKQMREETGMSQYDLANKLNVAQSTIGNWEAGKREPNYEMTIKVADLFGVTLDFLLGRTDLRDGHIIKKPAELADLGVVEVEKSGGDKLTPVEVQAIRAILEREQNKG